MECENVCIVLPSSRRNDRLLLDALKPLHSRRQSPSVSAGTPSVVPSASSVAPSFIEQSMEASHSSVLVPPPAHSQSSTLPQQYVGPSRSNSHRSNESQQSSQSINSSEALQQHRGTTDESGDERYMEESFLFFVPNAEYAISKAKAMCALLLIKGMPDTLTPDQRVAYLSHLIGDDVGYMRAMGALLSFIVQNGIISHCTNRRDDTILLDKIYHRDFCGVMHISPTTLWALNVFNDEVHPLGHGSMRGKEALSLYGILKARIKTASARRLLKSWLRYPSADIHQIEERQLVVNNFLDDSNRSLVMALRSALVAVGNVHSAIGNIRRVSASVSDWKRLYNTSRAFVSVIEALRASSLQGWELSRARVVQEVLRIPAGKLREVVGWIDSVIDFEESSVAGRLITVAGFSEEIDGLKRNYASLDDLLTKVGGEELERIQRTSNSPDVQSVKLMYEPSVGFLIVLSDADVDAVGLDAWVKHGFTYLYHVDGSGYHFRNERTLNLDDEIGDIHSAIIDLECKAIRYLESKVLPLCGHVLDMAELIRELDCLQGFAQCALENGWNMPTICENNAELVIENGKHPLLSLNTPSFVPNSTAMKLGDVHVVTGANYSGKSVYIHQVALLVILAQIGSAVPAEGMKMTVMTHMFGQLRCFESVGYGQSSFFEDASQVSAMLVDGQKRSLNLMDEFGKGTSEADGNALLACTLRELWERGRDNESITICTTHFIRMLKEPFAPVHDTRFVLFSMEVLLQKGDATRESTSDIQSNESNGEKSGQNSTSTGDSKRGVRILRTFRIVRGMVCTESWALQVAIDARIPRDLLERVADVQAALCTNGLIPDVVIDPDKNRRFREIIDDVRQFISYRDTSEDI